MKENSLYIDDCKASELAKKYGTPLYVYSETEILRRFSQLRECFIDKYKNVRVAYAAKAFFPIQMARLVLNEGICVDVVSGGELYTAIQANFPPERIEFNGNNKLKSELEMAVEYGVGRIIIDGYTELEMLNQICAEKNKKIKVLYRITPGVRSSTHDYIVTGKKDSKFGLPHDEDVIFPAVEEAMKYKYVELIGFHFHVGSQLFDNKSHLKAVDIILDMVKKLKEKFNYIPQELNLGGGFGATYVDEKRMPFEYFLDPMMEKIIKFSDENNMQRPTVVIEPGRSIVAEAGLTLYTVGDIKDIAGVRKYVSVDGGMTDNIRPALYQAIYKAVLADEVEANNYEKVTVCGKCCESGDIITKDINLPQCKRGDILAVYSTGAYGYSMASNYNKIPIPAVVFVKGNMDRLVVRRQSYAEMISLEVE